MRATERVGKQLQRLRTGRGLTQEQLTMNVGLSRIFIVRMELGQQIRHVHLGEIGKDTEGLECFTNAFDLSSLHYSRRFLRQPPIRCSDGRARYSVGQHTVQVCFPPSRLRLPIS